ncbi:glutamate synthase large subunit [Alkalibacterium pelagium]|uniref:Glutamate synthase (NADPH/NADH) large chain n=1 Tax=Alkalibacterium pelagium TaxID=426702 RepID=A0A1H7IB16_9LACT|nr:glutamate synthase large subunit [Alkalibacterium pelagium]GEN50026.1 glutamate synthase [NADPH] large chain [Alkalibacterium pelagium]SEK59733.1 glutamate synthase (NADPH/NADH) large chain [Alkalibacterium pelagium]
MARFNSVIQKQGLYTPQFERDNCGIGLYANMKGKKSHDIVKKGMELLMHLDHRGGQGSDPHTGDGSGVMTQIPDAFFRKQMTNKVLPESGRYGVGMIFFHQGDENQAQWEAAIDKLIEAEGQTVIDWRTVPTNAREIGVKAQKTAPYVRQIFVGMDDSLTDTLAVERKLYVIRKQAEQLSAQNEQAFYFPSFSSETIVYKGLLTSGQVDRFYMDLQDTDYASAFALVHSRFSTNTIPNWERAHPNRYLIHNGEINTLRGNINWMKAREKSFFSEAFGEDLEKILPILDETGSDSSVLDNALEFFTLAGRSLAHSAMMLIPEPWENNPDMSEAKRAFYQYHSTLMEPWDGPTSITFTNGRQIAALLDRNGLRPARYYVMKDDTIIYASETGVIDVDEADIVSKGRLSPGNMLMIDLEQGRIIPDKELKDSIISQEPYADWLEEQVVELGNDLAHTTENAEPVDQLVQRQKALGYTTEDIEKYLKPLINQGKDPIGAMGIDTPLAVLSDRPQSLFLYFKQLFAQVTNPPIDAYREQVVTSTLTWLGAEGNLLHNSSKESHRIRVDSPILSPLQFTSLAHIEEKGFDTLTVDTLFSDDLEKSLAQLHELVETAVASGKVLIVLSDQQMNEDQAAIPTLLAVSSVHQFLVRKGLRTKVSLIAACGEVREVHHFAAMIGYGADAVYPYLAYETIRDEVSKGEFQTSYEETVERYRQASTEGVIKVMSKMGISTVQSYRGAQIFEAIGISETVIAEHFTGTASQIDGIDLKTIAREARMRHEEGYQNDLYQSLDSGSEMQWRKGGERHVYNPLSLHKLQWAARRGDETLYKQYAENINIGHKGFIRHLFDLTSDRQPIPIEEVEPIEALFKRFKTGAMSFGSISPEAHETLAIAMNRLGGKSNSGEGGEDPARFQRDENGDLRRSAIKQVASGRFGVNSHYLVNAEELQIKMAQGAKPGEGGQLPGQKVYPWIASVRNSTPGVGLISPPPHHDIYSIEDLAQLIHDLKNANRHARISVKLAAKAGVGTIASGVAKGNADVISIVGYDGGTGASPKTSIRHAGLPWELGLAETHQTLLLNDLRERVTLETDGKLLTGRDVILAALIGAEEYGFATAPLVVLGCVMMRVCHLDTCPVGIATQNPELRKKFMGTPEHVIHFMTFIAQEVREILAELGYRSIDELIGRTDLLKLGEWAGNHWKASQLDLSRILFQPKGKQRLNKSSQNHKIDQSLDMTTILPNVKEAVVSGKPISLHLNISNMNRVIGTITGSEISLSNGADGLPEDTITLNCKGSAGQSVGAFIPKGMTIIVTGDANDYVGKGLSGGKLVVSAPEEAAYSASENVIAGNVAFYGATDGEGYINGLAGERFAVRNSGASLVVEGIGDHGCEYMTGGRVAVLGEVGKNFAAGMSGGVAYVWSPDREAFSRRANGEMVDFEPLTDDEDKKELKEMIQKHVAYTHSTRALEVLNDWDAAVDQFVKVIPREYKAVTAQIRSYVSEGLSEDEAELTVFMEKKEAQNKKEQTIVPS